MKLETFAEELWQAGLSRKGVAPLTDRYPALSLEDAYAISQLNLARRLKAGDRLLGKKIGITSQAVQNALGVREPDFGFLTAKMQLTKGQKLDLSQFLQPRIEGEIAFLLKADLTGKVSNRDVMNATSGIRAAFEIVDSRVADWKIKIQDTVADNASAAAWLMGEEEKSFANVDLRLGGMVIFENGEAESTGCGAACMDHPLNAVTWLANMMVKLGTPLQAGDVVYSGAWGPLVPLKPKSRYELYMANFAPVVLETL